MSHHSIPEVGYLKLVQIIGQRAVTPEEATINRQKAASSPEDVRKKDHSPKTPRHAIPALIPVSKSKWWAGVKSGLYPRPVKFGRNTFWRVEEIQAFIEMTTQQGR